MDFEVFLILVLSGAAFGFCSWCDCLGIFRDGIRWIWERTGRIIEDRQRELENGGKRREESRAQQSRAEKRKGEKRREQKSREEKRREAPAGGDN